MLHFHNVKVRCVGKDKYVYDSYLHNTWRSKVAVDSAAAIALSSAMALTLLESLSLDDNQGSNNTPSCPKGVEATILSIASDLKTGPIPGPHDPPRAPLSPASARPPVAIIFDTDDREMHHTGQNANFIMPHPEP